jgi:lipase ATG15
MGWDKIEVAAPDVTDLDTLAGLAKMCSNAYVESDKHHNNETKDWYDLGADWSVSSSFGWTTDGLRGHVFSTADNSTIVVAIKGTSAGGLVGGGGPTQVNDKTNDNLLFSCCCARVTWAWTTVCDCYRGGWKCNEDCVEDALVDKSVYYPYATDLYNNITRMYPHANIWLTGHSLGGSIASLLSLTFGVPCVTFEAPGDLLPAKRLHLPMPPGREPNSSVGAITHVYHTADPIPQCASFLVPMNLS